MPPGRSTPSSSTRRADGGGAARAGHVVSAEATDENTLVIHYDAPVGNVLAQLEQLFIVPQHVWEPLVGANGKNLKTFHPEQNLPVVSAGAYTIKEYEKKGTTVFIPWEGYYEKASNAEAVTLTYFTNSDSMISELRQGNLDWVDQVPFNAVRSWRMTTASSSTRFPEPRRRTSPGTRTRASRRTASSSTRR